jgi:sugar lactone lactonase YvrE
MRFTTLGVGILTGTLAVAMAPSSAQGDSTIDTTDLRSGQLKAVAGTGTAMGYEDGEGPGDGGDAREAMLGPSPKVDVAPDGTMYITDETNNGIRVVTTDGMIDSVDDAVIKMTPDGDDWGPVATAVDAAGALYVSNNAVIRKMEPGGEFTTIAGGGDKPLEDGAQATEVEIRAEDLATSGDVVYFVDDLSSSRRKIGRIEPDGTITIIAGGGNLGVQDSEGETATQAELDIVDTIAADSKGNVYLSELAHLVEGDDERWLVRKISVDGTMSVVAGITDPGFAGDGGPSIEAQVNPGIAPPGLAIDAEDRLLFIDGENNVIRRVDTNGVIDTIAPREYLAHDLTIGPDGNLYLAASGQVMAMGLNDEGLPVDSGESGGNEPAPGDDPYAEESPGTVLTVAEVESNDDTEPLSGIAVAPDGTVYVVGPGDDLGLLAIDNDGEIERIAGGADAEFPFANQFTDVEQAPDGRLYVAASGAAVRVDPDGSHVTLAGGTGVTQAAYEGQLGNTAAMANGLGLASAPDGTLYLNDPFSKRIYELEDDGRLHTFAEDAAAFPGGLAVGSNDTAYIADQASLELRAVGPEGESSILLGGDDQPVDDVLISPSDVAVDSDGTLFVSGQRGIRRIDPNGDTHTAFTTTQVTDDIHAWVTNLTLDAHGNLYFTESPENRVNVIVRPGEMSNGGLPVAVIVAAIGLAALATAAGAIVYRRRTS